MRRRSCSRYQARFLGLSGLTVFWLLVTGGVFSLFLAVLILMLPHAVEPSVAWAVGVYALCFGALLTGAAVSLRKPLQAR